MELMRVTVENLTEEDPLLCEIKQEMNDEVIAHDVTTGLQ